jgi:hypothetical protein
MKHFQNFNTKDPGRSAKNSDWNLPHYRKMTLRILLCLARYCVNEGPARRSVAPRSPINTKQSSQVPHRPTMAALQKRFEVRVSFDERRGYVAHANGLPTITALSRADASMNGSSVKEWLVSPQSGLPSMGRKSALMAAELHSSIPSVATWRLRCSPPDPKPKSGRDRSRGHRLRAVLEQHWHCSRRRLENHVVGKIHTSARGG